MGNQASQPTSADIPFPIPATMIPTSLPQLPITQPTGIPIAPPAVPPTAPVQQTPVQQAPMPAKTSAKRMKEIVSQYGLIPLTLTTTWQVAPPAIKDEFANGETVDYAKIEPDPAFWIDVIERFGLMNDPHPPARALIQDFYERQVEEHHKKSILSVADRERFITKAQEILSSNPKLDAFLRGTYAGGDASRPPEKHFLLFDTATDWSNPASYAVVAAKDYWSYVTMYGSYVYEIVDDVMVFVPDVKHAKSLLNDISWSILDTIKEKLESLPLISSAVAAQKAKENTLVFYDKDGHLITEGHNAPIDYRHLERTAELRFNAPPSAALEYGFDAAVAIAGAFLLRSLFR